jgi:hypothetical protein
MFFISVLVLYTLTQANSLQGISTTEPFNNSLTLDKGSNYFLFWNFNSTHLIFEVRVKTRGYVGFGLSPNGNMFPSDVVVGWVKDGKVFFKVKNYVIMFISYTFRSYIHLINIYYRSS